MKIKYRQKSQNRMNQQLIIRQNHVNSLFSQKNTWESYKQKIFHNKSKKKNDDIKCYSNLNRI